MMKKLGECRQNQKGVEGIRQQEGKLICYLQLRIEVVCV